MKKPNKQQLEEITNLAHLPDEAIDTSDIPEQTDWKNALVGRFYAKKTKTSVEIDEAVLSWFKAKSSRGYQRMINKALIEYMEEHKR